MLTYDYVCRFFIELTNPIKEHYSYHSDIIIFCTLNQYVAQLQYSNIIIFTDVWGEYTHQL